MPGIQRRTFTVYLHGLAEVESTINAFLAEGKDAPLQVIQGTLPGTSEATITIVTKKEMRPNLRQRRQVKLFTVDGPELVDFLDSFTGTYVEMTEGNCGPSCMLYAVWYETAVPAVSVPTPPSVVP